MVKAAENRPKPINEKCPIRTGRDADPSITAKNEKGETVAFCCDNCKEQFVANLPAMDEMMDKDEMMAGNADSALLNLTNAKAPRPVTPIRCVHLRWVTLPPLDILSDNLAVHQEIKYRFHTNKLQLIKSWQL